MLDSRYTKGEADYEPHAMNHKNRCELCKHFHPPHACEKVKGSISPKGWCKFFEHRRG